MGLGNVVLSNKLHYNLSTWISDEALPTAIQVRLYSNLPTLYHLKILFELVRSNDSEVFSLLDRNVDLYLYLYRCVF